MSIYRDYSLLSYKDLCELVKNNVIDAPLRNVNGSSIDITLDEGFMVEKPPNTDNTAVDLINGENIKLYRVESPKLVLPPKGFCLASSAEKFNLPTWISAEYKLKSSMARNGLQHMLAGWCDPGWSNSKLTLEFKNVNQFHSLILTPGMKIGQVVFWRHNPVPEIISYSKRGQYNNQSRVTKSKGIK